MGEPQLWFRVGPGTKVCIPGRVDLGYAGDEVSRKLVWKRADCPAELDAADSLNKCCASSSPSKMQRNYRVIHKGTCRGHRVVEDSQSHNLHALVTAEYSSH